MKYDQPNDRLPIGRDSDDYGYTRLHQPRVFALRPLVWQAAAFMVVGCALVVGWLAVTS